ncbi:hypothetical protein D9M70_475470 [compost metagenome]
MVEGGFGLLEVLAHVGQLAAEELQAVGRFGGGALDVLPDVEAADLVQHLQGAGRLVVFQGQGDDPGVLALFADVEGFLVAQDGVQPALVHHVEVGAGVGVQGFDLQLEAVLVVGLADLALEQDVVVRVEQGEVTVVAGDQGQRLVQQRGGDFQLEDLQLLATPGEAAQAEERGGQFPRGLRSEAAGQEGADHGEAVRFGQGVELQVVDRGADDRARLEQGDLGGGGRLAAEHLAHAGQGGEVGLLRLDLDHRVGAVDRRGQQCVGNPKQHEERRDAGDQPFVIEQGAEQGEQVDLVVVVGGDGHLGLLLHGLGFLKVKGSVSAA